MDVAVEKIREFMEVRGVRTLRRLSELAELNPSTCSRIMSRTTRRPLADSMGRIAGALKVPVDWLLVTPHNSDGEGR